MGTLPQWWTDPYPEVRSPKSAAEYLDDLGADLSRREEDGQFTLATGEQDLITSEDEAELDGFVVGFALAHLIVERHGLIGRRLPHPAERERAGEEASAGEATAGDRGGSDEDEGGDASEDDGSSDGEDGP